ncbi:hypothetical protein RYX36_011591 [Vicia faba]
MASSSTTTTKVTLKLLIDTKNQKVLFAEASKNVIDFLFNLLRLPVGTVVKLLTKNDMVGSIGNLYDSVENMNENYMQVGQTKDVLLNPRAPSEISGLLTANEADTNNNLGGGGTSYYKCPSNCTFDVTCDSTTLCSNCKRAMNSLTRYVGKKVVDDNVAVQNGFVKDVVSFMVMDDLVIQPMSTISSITLLNKFNVKEVGTLQEKIVEMGMDQGIKLLKASLQSKMVLTSVFLK